MRSAVGRRGTPLSSPPARGLWSWPEYSPLCGGLGLVQESPAVRAGGPWALVVAAACLTRAPGARVREVLPRVLELWPRPEATPLHHDRTVEILRPLGLARVRGARLLTWAARWNHAPDLPGAGPYVRDCWVLFVRGSLSRLRSGDRPLSAWRTWALGRRSMLDAASAGVPPPWSPPDVVVTRHVLSLGPDARGSGWWSAGELAECLQQLGWRSSQATGWLSGQLRAGAATREPTGAKNTWSRPVYRWRFHP